MTRVYIRLCTLSYDPDGAYFVSCHHSRSYDPDESCFSCDTATVIAMLSAETSFSARCRNGRNDDGTTARVRGSLTANDWLFKGVSERHMPVLVGYVTAVKLTVRFRTEFSPRDALCPLCCIATNTKWPFKVIQGHVFWSQWKGDHELSNTK